MWCCTFFLLLIVSESTASPARHRVDKNLPVGTWTKGGKEYGSSFFVNITSFNVWNASPRMVNKAIKASCSHPGRDIFQFGVYTGGSMKVMARVLPAFRRMWGFDSFQGVPAEDSNADLGHRTWRKGGWSSADALGTYNLDALMRRVGASINNPRAVLVPGFFNDSLPKMDLDALCPPFLVDVDSDLYISAMQALKWVFESGLACPGMLLRYDDWIGGNEQISTPVEGSEKLNQNINFLGFRTGSWGNVGEVKAHREISQKYELTWRPVANKPGEFVLVSIGEAARKRLPTRCRSCTNRREAKGCHDAVPVKGRVP